MQLDPFGKINFLDVRMLENDTRRNQTMFITAILILYFIISMSGIYTSFKFCNTDYELKHDAHIISLCFILFYLIVFSVIYLKQIITNIFIIWFIFDTASGLLLGLLRGYRPVVRPSKIRCVVNTICGIISCVGVLYILL